MWRAVSRSLLWQHNSRLLPSRMRRRMHGSKQFRLSGKSNLLIGYFFIFIFFILFLNYHSGIPHPIPHFSVEHTRHFEDVLSFFFRCVNTSKLVTHAYLAVREECPCVMDRTVWKTETLARCGIVRTCPCPKIDSCATGLFFLKTQFPKQKQLIPHWIENPLVSFLRVFARLIFDVVHSPSDQQKFWLLYIIFKYRNLVDKCLTLVKTNELTCMYFSNYLV